jgi:hypothetical protein
MGGGDLSVEVLGERALVHGRTVAGRLCRFNEALLAACACLLVGAPAGAVVVPGSGGHVDAGGWIDGLAVVDAGGGERQRPRAWVGLRLDATGPRWLSAHLELRGRAGGPFEGGHPGAYNFDHAFQNYSPAAEASEAYLDVHLARADLRVGVQKVAWGKLDGVPPTDVVNPRDYHDPLVDDVEERKIGIPALLGTWYAPDLPRLALRGLRATLVWVPIAVPSRLALREERWFPRSTEPPAAVTVAAPPPFPPRLRLPVRFGTANNRPGRALDEGGIALRIGGTWREQDWDVYHYTGPETGPDADLRPIVVADSLRRALLHIDSVLRQANDRIHMTGADWAAPLGPFTVRAEGAWFVDRPYLRLGRDLISPAALARLPTDRIAARLLRRGRAPVDLGDLFPTFDAVEWGVGADTVIAGFIPLLQVNQIVLLDRAPRLLIGDPETRVGLNVKKRLLAERLELELRGTYAAERGGWFLFPRASYLVRDDLRLRLGYLAVGGPRTSLIGQFARNDEVVFQARWSF